MQIEIEYANFGWHKEQRPAANGLMEPIERQTVWKQLQDTEWLAVDLVRVPSGFNQTNVYIESAALKREHQPNGAWRSAHPLQNFHSVITLLENPHARNTIPPTPPKPATNAAARYLATKEYAIPGRSSNNAK